MMSPEEARKIVLTKLPKGINLGPVVDYKGHYVFGVVDPNYIGHPAMGVNKTTGSIKEFNYMDPGLIKAGKNQYPQHYVE